MISMSTRIRRARAAADLTQAGLARAVGVERSAVAQWEGTPGTAPRTPHLVRIATTTEVCFEWLATGRGPMRPDDGAFEAAVAVYDLAQNEYESEMLELLRRLPPRKQQLACELLKVLAK
jgi:DNA-binding XRE family transcriptional regulator